VSYFITSFAAFIVLVLAINSAVHPKLKRHDVVNKTQDYRTDAAETTPEKKAEPVKYAELFIKTLVVSLGLGTALATLSILVMSARSDGRVDYCYVEYFSGYESVRLMGHIPWRLDLRMWAEKTDPLNSIAVRERVMQAASEFCPDGKVH